MPELGEIAHASSILRKFLVGKTVKSVVANEDALVFVNPLTSTSFQSFITGKEVSNVNRHGKYFWLRFNESPSALVLHFGMTGWVKVKGIKTHFIVMENGGDKKAAGKIKEKESIKTEDNDSKELKTFEYEEDPDMEWPPKFSKFILSADDDTEIAFTDPRRLGRVRLIENAGTDEELFKLEPLKRLGIDFSKPKDRWSLDTFIAQVSARKVPIKSLIMDQALFSGVGNWIADEILYQARIHPEIYSNTLDTEQLTQLYNKLIDICEFVVKVEGNTEAFPKDWLMLHRWGKRRKNEKQVTADGYEVDFVTVGGRTSCYVPALQKKSANKTSPTEDVKAVKGEKVKVTKTTRTTKTKVSTKVKRQEIKEEDEDEEIIKLEKEKLEKELEPPVKKERVTRNSRRNI